MKTFNFATLALAATCCVSFAQQPADDGKLKAIVQFDKERPTLIAIDSANGTTITYAGPSGALQGDTSKCKVFIIQSPKELVEGTKLHAAREFKKARAKLASCKSKYISYASLPNNPSLQAALLEIQCAVSMLDWPALDAMTKSFPSKGLDKSQVNDIVTVNAAKLLARVSDNLPAADGATLAQDAEKLLGNNAMKQTGGRVYGWVKYALARGLAAQVPAAEVKNREISAGNREKASRAIDAYCEAAVSPHGTDVDLTIDALRRAQALLWAMPGVKAYADSHPGKMDEKSWKKAPTDFKDAVAIAVVLKNVYEVKDPELDKPASFFFNAQQGKGKAK